MKSQHCNYKITTLVPPAKNGQTKPGHSAVEPYGYISKCVDAGSKIKPAAHNYVNYIIIDTKLFNPQARWSVDEDEFY